MIEVYVIRIILIDLTSIEKMTPPIGDPKATATPAALAAVTISLIFPDGDDLNTDRQFEDRFTLAPREPTEKTGYQVSDAASNMH
jgi:hypothetical protein